MADRYNIFNYFLRDTNSKLTILLTQTNVKKNSFLEQSFGIAFLYIDQRQAKSLRVLRAGSYVKQTKALSLIRLCDKDKGRVFEALILLLLLQF